MTVERVGDDQRRSRWLPIAVFSVFALVLLVEIVVIALYGNYRNLIEDPGLEVAFRPAKGGAEYSVLASEGWMADSEIVGDDGAVLVEGTTDGLAVRVPGELVLRFRAPNAGSFLELDYRFGKKKKKARCNLTLARVASRYGVDYMCRRSIRGSKKTAGTFRHALADHAGWFELSIDVNRAAALAGFHVDRPRLVRD